MSKNKLELPKGSRVIVLGGSGLLGKALSLKLNALGHDVLVLDRVEPNFKTRSEKIDFKSISSHSELFNNTDYVFHLISSSLPSSSLSANALKEDLEFNVLPSYDLLQICSLKKVKKIIFFSSGGAVYGNPLFLPITEEHPLNPNSFYGLQKLSIEKLFYINQSNSNLDYSLLRISNPYGLPQNINRPQGIIGKLFEAAINKSQVDIWGDGLAEKDYIYYEDVISAAIKSAAYIGEHKIFNIGTGVGTSIHELVKLIEEILNTKLILKYERSKSFDVQKNILNIFRAKEVLNWEPKMSLQKGLQTFFSETFK